MSDEPRVIAATFHDWRPVKGRKQLQLVFEVPLEQQTEVLTLLGPPSYERPAWYAIARLTEPPRVGLADRPLEGVNDPANLATEPGNSETAGPVTEEGKRLIKQCAVACSDEGFQVFLANTGWISVTDEETCADAVRKALGIKSRKEIGWNEIVQKKWKYMYGGYTAQRDYGSQLR